MIIERPQITLPTRPPQLSNIEDFEVEIPTFVHSQKPVNTDEGRSPHTPCHLLLWIYGKDIFVKDVSRVVCVPAKVFELIGLDHLEILSSNSVVDR